VVLGVLTCFDGRAVGANDGAGSARGDGDVEDLNVRFEHWRTRVSAESPNVGRSASCPKIATPSPFRLVGLFRSQSRNWTPPRGAEKDSAERDTPRSPPVVLVKKKKMRVLV
jgi:hypothetical protein